MEQHYPSSSSEFSSLLEEHARTLRHLSTMTSSATMEPESTWDSPTTTELSPYTHSNGYDLPEGNDGLFLLSGLDMAPTLTQSWTADQIQRKWPQGGLFRHYISRHYPNACGYEYLKDTSAGFVEVNVGAYIPRTLRTIQDEFLYSQAVWAAASETMFLLRDQLSVIARNLPITRVVGFAIGSFQAISPINRYRSQFQTAALRTIVECLEKSQNVSSGSIECFMQDPMLTELDIDFLATLGIEAINDPGGFLAVDANTLVYATGADDFIYSKLSQA
ncbi:MAG: hypothetical protein Q9207_007302, partial [Kuettlingeria erythrocarpa]